MSSARASPGGNPQLAPAGGHRRLVYRQRVLRSPRPGPGQVRDVRRVQNEGRRSPRPPPLRLFPPFFYQAQTAFQAGRVAGTGSPKRGPKKAHKLTARCSSSFEKPAEDPTLRTADLSRVQQRFHLAVHPRTIERGWARRQKKHGRRDDCGGPEQAKPRLGDRVTSDFAMTLGPCRLATRQRRGWFCSCGKEWQPGCALGPGVRQATAGKQRRCRRRPNCPLMSDPDRDDPGGNDPGPCREVCQ